MWVLLFEDYTTIFMIAGVQILFIRYRRSSDIVPSEITSYSTFITRREMLRGATAAGLLVGMGPTYSLGSAHGRQKISNVSETKWSVDALSRGDQLTPYNDVISYNNFYEFGTRKSDPSKHSHSMVTHPWTIIVDGHVEHPGRYDIDELIKDYNLEERVYRFRCVEAWSMVIPWVGIPLAKIIKRLGPSSNAKYVAFQTLFDPNQMPGQKLPILKWPYCEGLRMDEAMNPLSLLAMGLYGKVLPNQNGAPIRLVVPWKYGFKSIKSIVRITFTEQQPPTSWNMSAPREYGFYSNVNPTVHHPRWSQAKERRLGGTGNIFGLTPKIPTLMFNGYEEEVAELYRGMDLSKSY